MNNNIYRIVLLIWFLVVVTASYFGLLNNVQPPLPQILIFTIVVLLILSSYKLKSFRDWLCSIPTDWLVSIHLTRFIGFYFLALYSEGRLPHDFAVYGGWGDIAVATGAALILLLRFLINKVATYLYNIWNVLGLVDIIFVVATASRLALADPQSMIELLKLPLGLLPTFLVPIIIFTHLVIGYRLLIRREL